MARSKPETQRRYVEEGRKKLYGRRARYGLTMQEAAAIDDKQLCDGCHLPLLSDEPGTNGNRGSWHRAIDHNHETGKVRGVLHNSCNRAIGLLGDNPNRLEALAKYLRETS